jgi:hypothetical protein
LTKDFFGSFPIRQDIEILPADPIDDLRCPLRVNSRGKMSKYNGRLKLGWTVSETIGIAVINTNALKKLVK